MAMIPLKLYLFQLIPTVIQDFSFLLKLVCRLEEDEVFYLSLRRLSPLPSMFNESIATFIIMDNDRMLREYCNYTILIGMSIYVACDRGRVICSSPDICLFA